MPDKNAAALRVLANGKIFRKLGYEVVFIGIDANMTSHSEPQCHTHAGFECWSVPYPKTVWAWLKYITGLPAVLNIITSARDVKPAGVVCYNYPAVASLRIRNACKKLGIKMMSDATEWYDSSGGNFLYRLIKFLDTNLRMQVVHGLSDGVVTTSQYLTDFYAQKGKVTVELPTLFDADLFNPPSSRGNKSSKKFIYVGSPFDAGKVNRNRTNIKERLDACIELFYSLHGKGKDFNFDVFGISLNDYLKVFPEHGSMIEQTNGKIKFHGRQPNALVLDQIKKSDFSIFFRDRTRVTLAGFPSKLAESISVGTPVISNRMLSVERYAQCPGVFLAERGDELELVVTLTDLAASEVDAIKSSTFESRTFHYDNYTGAVSDFLKKVGV
ncbi:glycosyltransferase family 4 protein [Pseudomonas plecoglossicida]|uniref:glycosyltransferase family 4 protein n=1 Tax=Pseudomonas plecoglossicida TaxID=70775 RepID=UPI0011834666|nr:glycosyltransferase family 4 protein [Pseudomonas plecoglossicida]QLB56716.1 glycosyltransferase family 4 protein [Pseudomonas plecoglossicida]